MLNATQDVAMVSSDQVIPRADFRVRAMRPTALHVAGKSLKLNQKSDPPITLADRPLESFTGGRWYCAHVKPQQEFRLAEDLNRVGIGYFNPVDWVPSSTQRHHAARPMRPLFPGYLFVFDTNGERYRAMDFDRIVRFVPGVESCARQAILQRELVQFERLVRSHVRLTPRDFKAGDRVKVKSGSLAGVEGFVTREADDVRFFVMLSFLNAANEVDLYDTELELIAA